VVSFRKARRARLTQSPDGDGLTLTAFAGIAALVVSGTLLLDAAGSLVPVIGLVAGVAAMLGAGLERLKLRAAALEKRLGD
jgi:hypothetical protein